MINRFYKNKINDLIQENKVLVLYGPRRVGKTTLIEEFLKEYKDKYFLGFGENKDLQDILNSQSINTIKTFFSGYELIVIDEAQKIPSIGEGLKLIVDHIPKVKVIATGSSSFDLSNKLGEPLTGRQNIIKLFPIAAMELKEESGPFDLLHKLNDFLIYGSYPEVLNCNNYLDKINYLTSLRDSYLYKDILELKNIKNSTKILDLLRLLAFQIGQEVSLTELGNSLDLSKQTVERYLDLLEKTFVIINLRGYSGNLRKEVTKTSRYYFYDNGVRNSIINNFNNIEVRNDVGQLWENYLFIERIKKQNYKRIYSNNYFWRTYDQKEIDLVEEREGKLFGYEFKYKKNNAKPPKEWIENYKNASFEIITKDNFIEFIT